MRRAWIISSIIRRFRGKGLRSSVTGRRCPLYREKMERDGALPSLCLWWKNPERKDWELGKAVETEKRWHMAAARIRENRDGKMRNLKD